MPDEPRRIPLMAKLNQVPRVATPPRFDELKAGTYTLRAPFFESDQAEGGALQVGLEPYEYEPEDKREVLATVREDLGRRSIELALPDGKPFTVESSIDDDSHRVDALGRAVASLIVEDSMMAWMNIEADGDEPLHAEGPEGLNRLVQNLTLFALLKQETAAKGTDTAS